jgi:hypothetical protein
MKFLVFLVHTDAGEPVCLWSLWKPSIGLVT